MTIFFMCVLIVAAVLEFSIFFSWPLAKFIKGPRFFYCRGTSLENIVIRNEEQLKKIRFGIFSLLLAIWAMLSPAVEPFYLISSYLIFLLLINTGIALFLATANERKSFFTFKNVLRGLGLLIIPLIIWLICYVPPIIILLLLTYGDL